MNSVKYACKLGKLRGKYNDFCARYESGYISRKRVINEDTRVYVSGDGRLFYQAPAYNTTRYFLRCYLVKDGHFLREKDLGE